MSPTVTFSASIFKDVTGITFSKINLKACFFFSPPAVLPEEVQFLWRQAATVASVSGSNLQIREREPSSESAESEREREAAEREEERRELSSKEVWTHGV